jgi:hypothetical protein
MKNFPLNHQIFRPLPPYINGNTRSAQEKPRCLYNKVRYRGGFCVSCHVTGGGTYREIFALRRQVSLTSVPKVQLNASKKQ